jgi:hypothetical protein
MRMAAAPFAATPCHMCLASAALYYINNVFLRFPIKRKPVSLCRSFKNMLLVSVHSGLGGGGAGGIGACILVTHALWDVYSTSPTTSLTHFLHMRT